MNCFPAFAVETPDERHELHELPRMEVSHATRTEGGREVGNRKALKDYATSLRGDIRWHSLLRLVPSALTNEMNVPEKGIFVVGETYVPKFSFTRLGSHFVVGEQLIFARTVYERYDDIYNHEFSSESPEEPVKAWFLLRGETPEDWSKYFARVRAGEKSS